MNMKSYLRSFMDFVARGSDPHECWQENGFWPETTSAELQHLHVWGTISGLTYLENGGTVAYLQFISGRTLPEMEKGFAILGCPNSENVCAAIRKRFGDLFPREDKTRSQFVAQDRAFFEDCDQPMWKAMKSDDYENRVESYCEGVCTAHFLPPT